MPVQSPISVLGLGQCGSNVALSLSVSVDPLAPFGIKDLVSVKLDLRDLHRLFVKTFLGRHDVNAATFASHDFYIADMNIQNESYINGLKIDAMRPYVERHPTATYDDFKSHYATLSTEVLFGDTDRDLFDKLKRNPNLGKNVVMLRFRRPDAQSDDDFFKDGAGGLQVISEYRAAADKDLYSRISKQRHGTMIAMFAAGGGTGAGSVLSLLSRYRRDTNRYTLALGVLPGINEATSYSRAGRFICRFLGKELDQRFDSLFLFSNYAAMTVLSGEGINDSKVPAYAAVNDYLNKFVYHYTLINQPSNQPLLGKVFDPNDFKVGLTGISAVGFGSSRGKPTTIVDLLLAALSPLHVDSERMNGLGVSFGSDIERYTNARTILKALFDSHADPEALTKLSADLAKVTRFYHTIKSIRIIFFLQDHTRVPEVLKAQQALARVASALDLSPDRTISMSVYKSSQTKDDCCMVIVQGAYMAEILNLFQYFVEASFLSGNGSHDNSLNETFLEIIDSAKTVRAGEAAAEKLVTRMSNLLSGIKMDQEQFTDAEVAVIQGNADLKATSKDPVFQQYLVRRADMIKAGCELLELCFLPKAPFRMAPF